MRAKKTCHNIQTHGLDFGHVAPLDLGNPAKDKDLTLMKVGTSSHPSDPSSWFLLPFSRESRGLRSPVLGGSYYRFCKTDSTSSRQKVILPRLLFLGTTNKPTAEDGIDGEWIMHYQAKVESRPWLTSAPLVFGARMPSAPSPHNSLRFPCSADLQCHGMKLVVQAVIHASRPLARGLRHAAIYTTFQIDTQ
ncbi:hypothetical protein BDV06DRAFT_30586 [Aspergillus oleicola]